MLSALLARLGLRRPDPAAPAAMSASSSGLEAEQFTIRGIPVAVLNGRPDIKTVEVLERLDEALGLIEVHQPWRMRHLRRDIRFIRVERYACRGAFIPSERVVMTELTFLARRDITAAPVASSILHEGVHARVHALRERLARLTGSWSPERDAAREERVCRRAELAFGESLPPELGAPVIERALASLQLDDIGVAPQVDWREAQARIDAADRAAGA